MNAEKNSLHTNTIDTNIIDTNIIDNYKVIPIKMSFSKSKKHVLNNYCEEIFVINLITNKLRRNYITTLMKKYKVDFTLVLVEPINEKLYRLLNENKKLTKSEIGCTLSHLWCLNKILKEGYKNAIIFEDDIIFHKKFKELFLKIMQKQNFDFLLLGACDFSFSTMNYKNVKDDLYRPDPKSIKVYGAHAIYYSQLGAQKMLEHTNKNIYFFDRNFHPLFQIFPETSFICYPNLVVSDISTTNLSHEYPFFSESERFYYSNCFLSFSFRDYQFIYLSIFQNYIHVPFSSNETFESYYIKLLKFTFKDKLKQEEIKNRTCLKFFNEKDLQLLLLF